MLSKKKKRNTSQGMTYLEVIASLFAVAVIITPLCVSLTSSTKTKVESANIRESTLNAESLLEDIKEQLAVDIKDKNKREGNTLDFTTPSEIQKLETRVSYLTSPPTDNIDLRSFLSSVDKGNQFDKKYNTVNYSYEVALWKLEDILLTTSGSLDLNLDNSTLASAIKLCSASESGLKFDGYGSPADVVHLGINKDTVQAFQGKLFKDSFIPEIFSGDSVNNITGIAKIKIMKKDKLTVSSSSITLSSGSTLKINDPPLTTVSTIDDLSTSYETDGYIYNITDSLISSVTGQGIVVFDVRDIIRDFDLPLTFKFINNANYPVLVKLLRNVKENVSAPETLESIDENIDKKFNIVTEGSKSPVMIERIQDMDLEDNYLIAIVVRSKDPKLGEKGKIIKKIVDVYSYASSK